MSNSNQNIETPIIFVKAAEKYLNLKFEYDLAGTAENKKAPLVITKEENSLSIPWPLGKWCWLNPPFRNLTTWISKCYKESELGSKIVSIWPISCDLNQIRTWEHASVYIIHGRIWPEVRGCMLCVWDISRTKIIAGLRWNKEELIELWRIEE